STIASSPSRSRSIRSSTRSASQRSLWHARTAHAACNRTQAMTTSRIAVRGNLDAEAAPRLSDEIRAATRRREVTHIVVAFAEAGSLRMAGVAALSLATRLVERQGKTLELVSLGPQHRAALDAGTVAPLPKIVTDEPGVLERLGGRVMAARDGVVGFIHLII